VTAYLARRVLQAIAVLVLVTLIVYALLAQVPGTGLGSVLGPHAASGFFPQYLGWLGQVVHGNLGFSLLRNEPVSTLLAASLPRTIALTGTAVLLALIVAIPVGMLQAVHKNKLVDHLLRAFTLLCYGTPSFVLGSVLILVFAVKLKWFGAEGPQAPGFGGVIADWRDLTLPVLTLALLTIALFSRYLRSSAIESLAEDYVRTARAKGAGERRVLRRHVLRNSLLPVVTLVGLTVPQIMAGAVVVESIFNFQGMGYQLWQAAENRDLPVVLGFTLVIGAGVVVGSLLADIGYALLDPRVRYAER
jgi:peptide/nickel transport system permease protein